MGTLIPFRWNDSNIKIVSQKLSSHVVPVVIITRVCCFAWIPLTVARSRLEQWKVVDTALLLNGACRLDHSDVVTSLVPRVGRNWHPTPNLITINKHRPCIEIYIKSKGPVNLMPSMRLQFLKMDFHEQDHCDARLSKTCAEEFSVKISRNCDFRAIITILIGLLGHYLWNTLRLRENDPI